MKLNTGHMTKESIRRRLVWRGCPRKLTANLPSFDRISLYRQGQDSSANQRLHEKSQDSNSQLIQKESGVTL